MTLSVPAPILTGTSTTITATVTNVQNGAVTGGTASSDNTAVATTSLSGYTITVNGISAGPAKITGNVIMNGNVVGCTGFRDVTVIAPASWWQVKDGDVTTNGDLTSRVPSTQYFGTNGAGGYHGVPVFSGVFNLTSDQAKLLAPKWNVNSATTASRLFNYSYFENLVPEDVIPTVATDASLRSAGFSKYGYEWFKATGDLSINSNIDFGARKVILLLEGTTTDLNINARINLTNDSGFFLALVNGRINVGLGVSGSPAVEGIYMTDSGFTTGPGTVQLHVRGSVASHGGISLLRDLPDDSVTPSEIFEFAPDQILLFPDKLGFRGQRWAEVAP